MKLKIILCCLLASCMVLGCVTACNQEEQEPVVDEQTDGTEEETNANEGYDVHELVRTYSSLQATTEHIKTLTTTKGGPTNQGGYTDGKYYWQSFITMVGWGEVGGEVDNEVTIVKWDMETDTIVKESEKLRLNHCNDMTYNPKTGKIYVCNATGRKNIVSILNPDTLEVEGEVDLGFEIFCINYNESRDQYMVGIAGGQTFRLLDSNFQIIGEPGDYFEPTTRTIGYVTQGCCTDDDFIYFVLYKENVINVYDWEGNFVSWIKLDIPNTIEPENISIVDGEFYIGTNGAEVYKVTAIGPEE